MITAAEYVILKKGDTLFTIKNNVVCRAVVHQSRVSGVSFIYENAFEGDPNLCYLDAEKIPACRLYKSRWEACNQIVPVLTRNLLELKAERNDTIEANTKKIIQSIEYHKDFVRDGEMKLSKVAEKVDAEIINIEQQIMRYSYDNDTEK